MPTVPHVTALPHRLLVTLALSLSLESQALTLGRIQGAALIGRPLEVAVQVQLDPNQSITGACFEADVFHADTRQNPAGVQVRLEPAAAPGAAVLRISSGSRVDEPVVTIYVRAGCAQMSTRRYVMLADIVSEQAAPAQRLAPVPFVDTGRVASPAPEQGAGPGAGSSGAAAATQGAAAGPSGARSGASARSAAASPPREASEPRRRERAQSRRTETARPAAPARVAPQPAPSRAAAAAPAPAAATATPAVRGTGQSRLTLDPLEMLSERVATLESNAANPAQASEREARENERLDRLEASVKALIALAEKNEASLLDVRTRLEKAQADRFSNTVVYALFTMLLLSLLAIAYLLARINRGTESTGSRWFEAGAGASGPDSEPAVAAARSGPAALGAEAPVPPASMAPTAPAVPSVRPAQAAQPQESGPGTLPTGASRSTDRLPIEPTRPMPQGAMAPGGGLGAGNPQVDVSLVEMSESTFDRLMQSGTSHSAVRRVQETVPMAVATQEAPVVAAPQRPRINADELIDIRQRAEFFVTLGQTDQAVQVLEARIAQDGASCPQAYLDLFQLFHSLGLKDDFNQLRDDFLKLFNARIPEFPDYDDEGRSLEDYPGAVDRLIRAWNRPTVVGVLEQMLYADPAGASHDDAFDLAAFRDLLMLHAVAQTARPAAAGSSGAFDRAQLAPAGGDNGIDIDLSDLLPAEAAPTLVMPREGLRGSAAAGANPGVDLEIDVHQADARPAPAAPVQPPSDNLIDFDLGDVDFVRKPGKGS